MRRLVVEKQQLCDPQPQNGSFFLKKLIKSIVFTHFLLGIALLAPTSVWGVGPDNKEFIKLTQELIKTNESFKKHLQLLARDMGNSTPEERDIINLRLFNALVGVHNKAPFTDESGKTILHHAFEKEYLELGLDLILENRTDPFTLDNDKKDALEYFVIKPKPQY